LQPFITLKPQTID